MSIWEKAKAELLDIIEWTDESTDTLVWRFPRFDNEIKYGAQLVIRQSQAAVFVNEGRIADVFPPGRYRLATENLPLLTTLLGWKYGFHSPFKAEVYFVNTRNFTNLKWGTKNPLIIRDSELGPVRLRAFGTYVVRVAAPEKFINEIVGTSGHFTIDEIAEQLRNLIVTRFSDMLASSRIALSDLSASYNEISQELTSKIATEFSEYGIEINKFLVENIALPPEVESALDKKSSMGIIGNLDDFLKFQSATAMEAAASNPGGEASAGVGMGIGFAMANQMGRAMSDRLAAAVPASAAPPPLADSDAPRYFVGSNGRQSGPYEMKTIAEQITAGAITRETLLWRSGMEKWEQAGQLAELAPLFRTPPPLPQ